MLSLCELGTHVLWRSLVKPCRRGEVTMAPAVLRPDMLLLWDRNFFSYARVRQVVVVQNAQLLARVKTGRIFRPIRVLSDGSYVARVHPTPRHRERDREGIEVRIVEYTLRDRGRAQAAAADHSDGRGRGPGNRPGGAVPREAGARAGDRRAEDAPAGVPGAPEPDPVGVVQDVYGLRTAHGLVRTVMRAAARAGVAPRQVSCTGALKVLRRRLAECPDGDPGRERWHQRLVAEIADEVLPQRRSRINPRAVKKKMSHWNKKRPEHRPPTKPKERFRDTIEILR